MAAKKKAAANGARAVAKCLGLEFVDWNAATMHKKREIVGNEKSPFGLPAFAVMCAACKTDMSLIGLDRHSVAAVCSNKACPKAASPNAVKVTTPFVLCGGG